MDNITNWILDKVINHLVLREGCSKEPLTLARNEASVAVVTDSLGFRYEIQIKCVGRLKNSVEDADTVRAMS